jgi:multimeric flavodoxin WrbA
MRVLAIIGSPRKGNTYKFVQRIEDELKALAPVQFDYLFLKDANLGLCRGCYACLAHGEDHCPLKDDRAQIEKDMIASNGVIFASPVYALNVTALMKNLLDRMAYSLHRPRFFEQRAMSVCTTGAVGLKQTISALSVVKYAGFIMTPPVGVAYPSGPASPATNRKVERAALSAAKHFHEALTRPRPSPSLHMAVAFRAQQAAFDVTQETAPADHKYFSDRGWLDHKRRYYVNVQVNPLKAMLASLVGKVVRRSIMKKMGKVVRVR